MTQILDNLKCWNPHQVRVPTHLVAEESEVQKAIAAFKADGTIPDITINEEGELVQGLTALEAAKRLEQQVVMVSIVSAVEPEINIEFIPIELLDEHPKNSQIYGEVGDVSELVESILKNGLQEIFTVTPRENGRYTIIHGHRRRPACKQAGFKRVPAKVKIFASLEDELSALLAGNEYREKSIEQKAREFLAWEDMEKRKAKTRHGRSGEGMGPVRDIVAKRVGLGSGVNAEHAVACLKVLDETADAPPGTARHQQHQQLKQVLSKPRGVDAAYKLIKPQAPLSRGAGGEQGGSKNKTPWKPKETEIVEIIGGTYKGKQAEVRVICGSMAMCLVDGDDEDKRRNILLSDMRLLGRWHWRSHLLQCDKNFSSNKKVWGWVVKTKYCLINHAMKALPQLNKCKLVL